MKLHLPLSLRSALLAACVMAGTSYSDDGSFILGHDAVLDEEMTQDIKYDSAVQEMCCDGRAINPEPGVIPNGGDTWSIHSYTVEHERGCEQSLQAEVEINLQGKDTYSYIVDIDPSVRNVVWILPYESATVNMSHMKDIKISGTTYASVADGTPEHASTRDGVRAIGVSKNKLIISISDSETFEFSDNGAVSGSGALTTEGSLDISNTKKVLFKENRSVIFKDSTAIFSGIEELTFDNNAATLFVCSQKSKDVQFSNVEELTFTKNCAQEGVLFDLNADAIQFGAEEVYITENTANNGYLFKGCSPEFNGADIVSITKNKALNGRLLSQYASFSDIDEKVSITNNEATYRDVKEHWASSSTSANGYLITGSAKGLVATGSSAKEAVFELNRNKGTGDFSCMVAAPIELSSFSKVDIIGNELHTTIANSTALLRQLRVEDVGEINIKDNRVESLSDATQKYTDGGGNVVDFETAQYYLKADKITISGNSNTANDAAHGGALYAKIFGEAQYDEIQTAWTFADSKQISITGNWAKGSGDSLDVQLLNEFRTMGGAIYMSSYLSMRNEPTAKLEFSNNDKVEMRGNYITDGSKYMLNAIALDSMPLIFKTKENQEVICYDSIEVWDGAIHLNGDMTDKSAEWKGSITFSGAHAEEDLKALGSMATAEELEASRKIIANEMHLWGGKLTLEETTVELTKVAGYYLTDVYSNPLFTASNSATVIMHNVSWKTMLTTYGLQSASGRIDLPNTEFYGNNLIETAVLNAQNGTWTFHVTAENAVNPLVSLNANVWLSGAYGDPIPTNTELTTTGQTFIVDFDQNNLLKGKYKLLELKNWDGSSSWTGVNTVKVTGTKSGSISTTVGSGDVYLQLADGTYTLWFDYSYGPDEPMTPAHRGATTLTWTGAGSVWKDSVGNDEGAWSANVEDLNFYANDKVVFADATTLTVEGMVKPADVLVKNESGTVTITGKTSGGVQGQIGGAAKLTKQGEGELVLNLGNSYTGGTEVKGGTLTVGHENALSVGEVTLTGGTLNLAGYGVGNAVEVTGAASIKGGEAYKGELKLTSGTLTLGDVGEGTLQLAKDAELLSGELKGELSGEGGVVKSGGGTVSITGAALSYTGDTVVSGGTLEITLQGAAEIASKKTTVSGGALELSEATLGGEVTVEKGTLTLGAGSAFAGGSLTVGSGGTLAVKDDATAHGQITLGSGATATHVGAGFTLEQGDVLTLDGATLNADVTVQGGKLTLTAAQKQIGGSLALEGGEVTLGATPLTVAGELSSAAQTDVHVDVDSLLNAGKVTLISATDASRADVTAHFHFVELEGARYESGVEDDKDVWVELNSADLTWDGSASGAVWGVGESIEWLADDSVQDRTFYNLDSVTFDSAGEVPIKGEVRPSSITVTGDGDTSFVPDADKPGSIIGSAALVKSGKGNLTMGTDNADYSGTISVTEGTLTVASDHALGTGAVYIDNAAFRGGGYENAVNTLTFTGDSSIEGADKVRSIVFAGATVSGSYRLEKENTLTVMPTLNRMARGAVGSSFTGDFTFAGGTLELYTRFDITGTASFDTTNGKTTLDLSHWEEEIVSGGSYELIGMQVDANLDAEQYFTLSGLADSLARRAELEYIDGVLTLTILRPAENPEVALQLSRNKRAAYHSLAEIAENGLATGSLARLADAIVGADDADYVRSMLARIDGEELATMMNSQIEGNLSHLRRLRSHIGTGALLSTEHDVAAYVSVYNDDHHVSEDASGLGYRRSEWGAALGMETKLSKGVLLGAALSSGGARVTPTGGARHYKEDTVRVDMYAVADLGSGWQSVTTLGVGSHNFDTTRALPDASVASTQDVKGSSLNFSQEISYTVSTSEETSLQGFLSVQSSVNHIDGFAERGADTASLVAGSRDAWATDVTLGSRFHYRFAVVEGAPAAVAYVQTGLVASVGDTGADLTLRFTGAPQLPYHVTGAKRNRWGYNVGAGYDVPVSPVMSVFGSAEAVFRGDSNEFDASVGLRVRF